MTSDQDPLEHTRLELEKEMDAELDRKSDGLPVLSDPDDADYWFMEHGDDQVKPG